MSNFLKFAFLIVWITIVNGEVTETGIKTLSDEINRLQDRTLFKLWKIQDSIGELIGNVSLTVDEIIKRDYSKIRRIINDRLNELTLYVKLNEPNIENNEEKIICLVPRQSNRIKSCQIHFENNINNHVSDIAKNIESTINNKFREFKFNFLSSCTLEKFEGKVDKCDLEKNGPKFQDSLNERLVNLNETLNKYVEKFDACRRKKEEEARRKLEEGKESLRKLISMIQLC